MADFEIRISKFEILAPIYFARRGWFGKRVLITGGLGFIGSNLTIRLVREGARVSICDAMIEGYGGNFANIRSPERKAQEPGDSFSDITKLRALVGMGAEGRAA